MRGLSKLKGLADELGDEMPTEVRMQRTPVSITGTGEDASEDELPPATIYPNGDPRADLIPREGGYPEGWGMDLREKRKPAPKPSVDDEPMSELLANFTKGAGGVADRAQEAMDGPERSPGAKGFLAKATTAAAMGKGQPEPEESEVQQLRAQLQAPQDEPEELRELLAAQRQRGTASDLSGVSDALYSTFSRTPLKPMQQRDQVKEFAERDAMSTSIDAKAKKAALEDPNSAESQEARTMFAATEAGKTFQKEMGSHFDRLPASKIPGSEFLIKASQRKSAAAVEMDPTKRALMEAQARNLDARTAEIGRPKAGGGGGSGGTGVGKPPKLAQIPSTEASNVGELDAADKTLDALEQDWQKEANQDYVPDGVAQYFGGTKANRYAKETMTGAAQTIGTIMEGGKLTDADLPKYLALLPTAGDSEDRAKDKIRKLRSMIANKKTAKLAGMKAAGFNTSGFEAGQAGSKVKEERTLSDGRVIQLMEDGTKKIKE